MGNLAHERIVGKASVHWRQRIRKFVYAIHNHIREEIAGTANVLGELRLRMLQLEQRSRNSLKASQDCRPRQVGGQCRRTCYSKRHSIDVQQCSCPEKLTPSSNPQHLICFLKRQSRYTIPRDAESS